jgi:hypothetical protein
MPTWKSILLKAAGFGTAFALTLCMAAGGVHWYTTRPRPWNKTALKSTFSGLTYQAKQDAFVLTFEYALENTTNRDYTMPPDTAVFERMVYDSGYGHTVNAEIVGDTFIPAKHQILIKIQCTYDYADMGTTFQETVDDKKSEAFASKRLNRIDSFELFDKENKYEVDLPNSWANWDKVKNAFQDEKKTQAVKAGAH